MKLIHIFLLGVGILVCAIVLNVLAQHFSVLTWFSFVENPGAAETRDYVWLFGVYPFALGLSAYLTNRILRK